MFEIITVHEGEVIFNFEDVPRTFFVVKSGRVKIEDKEAIAHAMSQLSNMAQSKKAGLNDSSSKQHSADIMSYGTQIKIEGEWIGLEFFLRPPFSRLMIFDPHLIEGTDTSAI